MIRVIEKSVFSFFIFVCFNKNTNFKELEKILIVDSLTNEAVKTKISLFQF